MEDPIPYDDTLSNPNVLQNDVGLLPIPSLDSDMLTGDLSFPENFSGDDDFPLDVDFDFTFDDLSFADDLLSEPQPEPEPEPETDIENPGSDLTQAQSPNVAVIYDSEESNCVSKSNCPSPEFGSCKSNSGVVSRDSGNNSDRDVSSSSFIDDDNNLSAIGGLDKKIKIEEVVNGGSKCMSKRKQDEGSVDVRSSKFRRSLTKLATESAQNFNMGSSEEDDKKKARLMRNRESAQLSRQRKKQYVEELEDKVRSMHSTITELNSKISYIMAENASLRQQLSGGAGVCAPPPPMPPPGMYPMAPMPYPWMPCPPYMLKPQGSPVVPIPRLKPQKPTSGPKVTKKSENKKGEGKTKKVASISLLGLLFFFVLFGGLVPMVNVRYGGNRDWVSDLQIGTVLGVDKHVERRSFGGGIGVSDGKLSHGRILQQSNFSDGNSTEPLVASLYVPRNDKLVKIDGNLIIHSVLASEKAMASHTAGDMKTSEKTSLAIARSYPPYPIPGPGKSSRHPHLEGNPNRRQRALSPSSSDELNSAGSEGKLQQWFREGLTGPMLSSGMCTEVFQFDVSPVEGAIIPATSILNTTSQNRRNTTRLNKPRNRRILHGHPIPLDNHTLNATEENTGSREKKDKLQKNKSRSSMVVSVLVDPREVGDGDGEGVIRSKTLSRIFVVVLIDSVKYVTYSCMLPFMGSGTHMVTT